MGGLYPAFPVHHVSCQKQVYRCQCPAHSAIVSEVQTTVNLMPIICSVYSLHVGDRHACRQASCTQASLQECASCLIKIQDHLCLQVGVDVPAASVMVVWDADRFGLAQLHQFRGRVGRGTQASTCFLVTRAGPLALNRLSIMERSHDGFEIAEVDLEHR